MLFVCHPKCTTCQKARAWLEARGAAFTSRDIRADRPSLDELRGWQAKSGLPPRRFFNTGGLLYKELSLKDRLPALSDEAQLALLATDGMLIKRPILVAGETVLVGFRPDEWAARL